MESQQVTLYMRPECELCDEARQTLTDLLASSTRSITLREVDIEQDPALHQRLLAEIPAIECEGELLPHATSRMRIEQFLMRNG